MKLTEPHRDRATARASGSFTAVFGAAVSADPQQDRQPAVCCSSFVGLFGHCADITSDGPGERHNLLSSRWMVSAAGNRIPDRSSERLCADYCGNDFSRGFAVRIWALGSFHP